MDLKFISPGPVSAAYKADRSSVSAIMGPVGSAKTSTTIMKLLEISAEQAKSPVDGIRYSKWMVVRDTYRNLNRTTLKSFKTWLPLRDGQWTGGGSDPALLSMRAKLPDGSIMDLQVEFVALGDNTIEDVARGWEGTGVWLNEGDLLPPDVISYLYGRCGRYPSKLHGGASWFGVLVDYNAPDTENYLYQMFEEAAPEGYSLFKQPGGRTAEAENLENLAPNYYDNQVKMYKAQGRDDLVKRMIDNQYGFSRDGKPVYPEYRDSFHCADRELKAVEGLPIKISVDQGLHPAAILRQTMPDGQRRILDELYCDGGAKGLSDMVLRAMGERYPGYRLVGAKCDLHGDARSATDATSWLESLNKFLGLKGAERIMPAETDKPDKLTAAVKNVLKTLVDNARPALLISSRCKVMRKGFNSAYCYKRMKGAGHQFADKPMKGFPTADVMNALEFDCLDEGGYEGVVGRAARSKSFGSRQSLKAKLEVRV